MDNYMELTDTLQMLPPPPGSFIDREELIQHVGEFALSQGYVVTIKQSKKDKVVVLGCDRGGVYRNRRKPVDESSGEQSRKRKTHSRLTNCPFELVGKKEDGLWVLTVKNGSHNHEALKDISEHPSARRFTEKEVLLIKEMTEAGLKPRQILKRLRQSNPELSTTSKHVYNVKAKLRQGNVTVRRLKTLRPQPGEGDSHPLTATEPSWRKRYPPRVPNLIGGRFVDSQSSISIDVMNPATQQVVSQVPFTTSEEFKAAVFAAKRAFPMWRNTPITTRQRIMFKLQELIRRDVEKLALDITTEQGKTLKDAYNDVYRGLEVVEHACGMATLQMGDFSSNISNGIDSYCIREPLGVCAGICPHNFPAMIPLWMFPIAVTCGNTFILKPSEKAPGACMRLAELAMEAGLPNGVLNIVHGTHDMINAICDDENIKAVSTVGSDAAGKYIHERACGKRIQANIGAKNFTVVMPDANVDATLNALVAAGFGAAGQRCTAISTAIFVGSTDLWENKLVERAKALEVNEGTEPSADIGPVISKLAKERISSLIQAGVDAGARLALDGRQIVVSKFELGNFIGPTILFDVKEDMELYKVEIFGPVLLCMQVPSLEEGINIINRNKYGVGASIFTASGAAARKFQTDIESGQVGINVAVPAPLPFVSFAGSKATFAGDLNFYGKAGVHFYTQIKTVTQQWKDFLTTNDASPMLNSVDLPSLSQTMQTFDFPSSDIVSLGLQSGDYSNVDGPGHFSNVNGASLALNEVDFSSSDGESLPEEHSKDMVGDGGISPSVPTSHGVDWTLNF
ncbi:OLC1v1002762C1 [Oldenlandia corymbosa var. corymbosa]|uniref:methylmalonate-semialdehyde dehydrogenase (CoA acylating) n=1 Tax=Oldenlandia corymbosa var. corymbosa TaxID=529605 RepID=A0AAV1D8F5_OLDCO|nr:OLC1v1002762C1 [Oldenlandia corymbosa var. corymbosa]